MTIKSILTKLFVAEFRIENDRREIRECRVRKLTPRGKDAT
jgi:hypothetical protein